MSTSNDPGIVQTAPKIAALIGSGSNGAVDIDRARGVMLGLAVGNLLGLPVEGASREAITQRYPNSIREIDPSERNRPMDDDLAQAVDLAEALVQDDDPASGLAERLVRWRKENGRGIGIMTSSVIDDLEDGLGVPGAARAYWQSRGRPVTQPNGALMRCAPVAIGHASRPERLISETCRTCAVTHYAPGAQWSCIIVNAAIAMLLSGGNPNAIDLAAAAVADGAPPEIEQWVRAIPANIEQRIAEERVSGHTYLCMQAALWCLDTEDSLEDALVRIVSAGGDTDTNGAVAGAVLGARYGVSAIPQRWLACIPQPQRIEESTKALLSAADSAP